MAFQGWTGDFVGFFHGLELDNSKRYFEAHRQQYEREVRGPLQELADELEPVLGGAKIFRINRDIRFSSDKSPYKTNVAAVIGQLYVHLDGRSFFVATGAHHPGTPWLTRYRAAVDGPAGEELVGHVERMRAAGLSIGGNPMKTTPRGYRPDHPRIELLRWREVVASKDLGIGPWIATPAAKDRVLEAWEAMRPFAGWLRENVAEEQ